MLLACNRSCIVSMLLAVHFSLCVAAATESVPHQPESSSLPGPLESQIHFWYGDSQLFGSPGLAQRWVNILGHVDKPGQLASVFYSLNGAPGRPLGTGPDSRRLPAPGDFNIELDARDVRDGRNTIRVWTSPAEGGGEEQEIDFEFRQRPWPLPTTVDWSATENIQDAVQIVDGMWLLTEKGLRTAPDRIGYDRSLALGDRDWSGYEILVPVTPHALDTSAYGSPVSLSPGFGLVLHWNGHTSTPVRCGEPHCGWLPAGAFHWYNFPRDKPGGLNISTGPILDLSVAFPYALTPGTTYLVRSRVEPLPLQTLYYLKIWKKGENEPQNWSLQRTSDRKDPGHGGILLVAHHVDLTIGNIEIRPVAIPWPGRLRQYLALAPLLLTLAAGLPFLLLVRIRGETGRHKAVFTICCAVPAAIICFALEPYLPQVLRHLPLSAGMAALLYWGFDFLKVLFPALVWIILLLYLMRGDKREAIA